jgi:dihydrolipoamide dehydrogenase
MVYKKRGIDILTDSSVEKVDIKKDRCIVTVKTKNGEVTLESDIVLSAAGVQTNLENLGLEEMGIKSDKGKVVVDDFYRTSAPGVYAIGDIVPGPALAHVASAEGIICVEAICGHHPAPLNYGNIPGCTYTHPEVASVGYTEAQAKEKGYEIMVGKFPFSASGKAAAGGHKDGFVKVIFDKKYGEWLGCHMVGEGVTDIIIEAVVARNLETTGLEILKSIHPHPTMSEAVMEAVAQAYGECIHL